MAMATNEANTTGTSRQTILISGGSGFIGSRLAARLIADGHTVVVLTRQTSTPFRLAGLAGSEHLKIRQYRTDDSTLLFRHVAEFKPDFVFHLAAQPDGNEDFRQLRQVVDANISLTTQLLEACRRYPVRLFVYADTSKVYGNQSVPYRGDTPADPICTYAIAKLAGWQFCEFYRRHHGVPSVSVRPTLIYGPGQGYNLINFVVESIIKGRHEITLMGGQQTRDPLFIEDVMELFLRFIETPERVDGRIINIGGGRETSILDIARMIAHCMRVRIQVRGDDSQVRPTEIWRSYCLSEEARELLGWQPATTLEDGLERTIESLLSSPVRLPMASA